MSLVRHYGLAAAAGREAALEAALIALAHVVGGLPGCRGIEVLRDGLAPGQFVFVEQWESKEAHQTASAHLPKDAFAAVMAELGEKPGIRDLSALVVRF